MLTATSFFERVGAEKRAKSPYVTLISAMAGGGKVLGAFYIEFDNKIGPKIVSQYPKKYLVVSSPFMSTV